MPTVEINPDLPASLTGETSDHVVLRYDPDAGILLPLPNVLCLSVSARVGAEPWSARFRYKFSQLLDPAIFPSSFEQVFLLSSPGAFAGSPFVVRQEDRLIVRTPDGDGSWRVLFDGFARLPQVDYGPGGEVVTFECIGTPERCWDEPIGGAFYRDAITLDGADEPRPGRFVRTSLPARFNPDGKPNATPEGSDYEAVGAFTTIETPTFTDPLPLDGLEGEDLEPFGRRWSLAMAARYLIALGNPDETWVINPSPAGLDLLLSSVGLAEGYSWIDWSDPDTYELEPILCPDLDVTGMAWPEALQQILTPFGFTIAFELETVGGLPRWRLLVRRNDDNTHWRTLGLQVRGAAFDPGLTSVLETALQRSGPSGNEVVVDSAPDQVEASFVLSPFGFAIEPGDEEADPDPIPSDADKEQKDRFIAGSADFEPTSYRLLGLDELGEGHWRFPGGAPSLVGGEPADLTPLFPTDPVTGAPGYVRRRRPGSSRLLSLDEAGQPRKAELWFALLDEYRDGPRPVPGVYEPLEGVQWQQVTEGGWRLLPDRLGVEITAQNARAWKVTGDGDRPVCPSGVLDLVRSLADPSDENPKAPRVVFRLTTVIEADAGLKSEAPRRVESPSRFTVKRRVDSRDRFAREVVSASSIHHAGGPPKTTRDDSAAARAQADQLRRDLESVRFAGMVTIPRVAAAIRPADKLVGLSGRDVLLGGYQPGTDEGPRYPMVVGVEWHLDLPQSTRLMLDDRRAESWTMREARPRELLD